MLAACDLPTQAPDFSFSPSIRGPVIVSKTLQFLGPGPSGEDALVDTTSAAFDSLFLVDPTDQSLHLSYDLDRLNLGSLDGLLQTVDVPETQFDISLDDYFRQSLDGSWERSVGVYESPPVTAPGLPLLIEGPAVYYPVPFDDFLLVPVTSFLDLSGSEVEEVTLTGESGAYNAVTFTLTNGLDQVLTDDSFSSSSAPIAILQDPGGSEILRQSFDRPIAPGTSESATLALAGERIPAGSRVRFLLGTDSGLDPVLGGFLSISVSSAVAPLRYRSYALSEIQSSGTVDLTESGLVVSSEIDFVGAITSSGAGSIRVVNSLPIPLQLSSLELYNEDAVESYPPGHRVVAVNAASIPAGGSTVIPIELGENALGTSLSAVIRGSTPYVAGPVEFFSTAGVHAELSVDVDIDRLLVRPAGETVFMSGVVDLSVDDVVLSSDSDYLEIGSGALSLSDLESELDITIEDLALTFPTIRRAPYGPSDTLVIRFTGTTDKVESAVFSKIQRKSPPRSVQIDLSGLRIHGADNTVPYHVTGRGETSADVRVLIRGDGISAGLGATGLQPDALVAELGNLAIDVTEDRNGDGFLEVADPVEALATNLSALGELSRKGMRNLALVGTSVTLNLESNLGADVDLIGVFMGRAPDGSTVFLSGRNEYAVSASEPDLARLRVYGAQATPEQALRLPISASSAGSLSRQTFVLTSDNSSVDEFVSNLPEQVLFVGRASVATPGARVELQLPLTLEAALGVSVPLRLGAGFQYSDRLDMDLAALSDLADPNTEFSLDAATLRVHFKNGIPLGAQMRLDILDAGGTRSVSFPQSGRALRLAPAPAASNGFSNDRAVGSIEVPLSQDELRRLAGGSLLDLTLDFTIPPGRVSHVRATDELEFEVEGDFRFTVDVDL